MDGHSVNIPFLDDWMFVELFEKARDGTLAFHDLWKAQMEHRITFVRLLILARHHFWPDDVRPEMWLSWLFLAGTAASIAVLMRRSFGPFQNWWKPMLAASLVIFTPLQYQIVLWGMMFQVACIGFFLTSCLVVMSSERLPAWARLLICVPCALSATLSFASGLLIWPLIAVLIACGAPFASPRARRITLAIWLILLAATAIAYFNDLKNEVPPEFSYGAGDENTLGTHAHASARDPKKIALFAMRFAGGLAGRGINLPLLDTASVFGALIFLILLASLACWLRHWRSQRAGVCWLPWLLLGSYTVGTGLMVALGRSWATSNGSNAVSARYVIHDTPAMVAVIALLCLAARESQARRLRYADRISQALRLACGLFLSGQGIAWLHGDHLMSVWESSRLRGAATTLFTRILPVENALAAQPALALRMDDMGLLRRKMLSHVSLSNFHISKQRLSQSSSKLVSLAFDGDRLRAEGYSALDARERPADAVIFAWSDPRGKWRMFHVTLARQMPLFLDRVMGRDLQYVHSPAEDKLLANSLAWFRGTSMDTSPFADRRVRVAAWALDYRKDEVKQIPGEFYVDVASHTIQQRP